MFRRDNKKEVRLYDISLKDIDTQDKAKAFLATGAISIDLPEFIESHKIAKKHAEKIHTVIKTLADTGKNPGRVDKMLLSIAGTRLSDAFIKMDKKLAKDKTDNSEKESLQKGLKIFQNLRRDIMEYCNEKSHQINK